MAPRAENPRDSKNHKTPRWKKLLAGGAALASLNALTACSSTEVGAVPKPNETTATTSAPATATPETPKTIPTPEASNTYSPEANPFVDERFNEMEAMSLVEFEQLPLADRVHYSSALHFKLGDDEWSYIYPRALRDSNPLNGGSLEDANVDIAKMQKFKEVTAANLVGIDDDPNDFGRKHNLLTAQKLMASIWYESPANLDVGMRKRYEGQLNFLKAVDNNEIAGLSVDSITDLDPNGTNIEFTDNDSDEKYTARYVTVELAKDNQRSRTKTEYRFVPGINPDGSGQWMVVSIMSIATADLPDQSDI